MSFDVFISYSTKDIDKVKKVKEVLEDDENVNVFVAEYSVKPGEKLPDKIKKNIKASNLFILLWSKNSKSSDWVSQEIGIAKEGDKIIIPVLLDKELTPPGFISDLKYLSAHDNFKDAVSDLRNEVKSKADKFHKVSSIVMVSIVFTILYLLLSND